MDKGAHFYKCDFQVHSPRDANWKGKRPQNDDERRSFAAAFVTACRSNRQTLHAWHLPRVDHDTRPDRENFLSRAWLDFAIGAPARRDDDAYRIVSLPRRIAGAMAIYQQRGLA